MITKDDNELVFEVLRGSRSSFGILIERYQKKIYGMILQMTNNSEMAKDLTQDVFIKAYTGLPRFNFNHRFFSWLYRIALNETISHLKSRRQFISLDKARSVPSGNSDTEPELENTHILRESLLNLKSDYRSLILLKYYFGLSYEDIAETLGISVSKVRDRLFNARMSLRNKLKENRYFGYD
jgi:RNA polymerase sigma-70 factor (ECF subfamily)